MPDIKPAFDYTVRFTEREFRVILRALGYLAGIRQIKPSMVEIEESKALNIAMLNARRAMLIEQVKIAEGALRRAEHPDDPLPEAALDQKE